MVWGNLQKGDAMSIYRVLLSFGLLVTLGILLSGCTPGNQTQPVTDRNTAVALTAEQETSTAQMAQVAQATAVAQTVSALAEATSQAEATQASATTEAATATAAAMETAAVETTMAVTAAAIAAETATAVGFAQATQTTVALSTARAEMVAEVTAVFIAEQEALVEEAKAKPPFYGPASGDLPHVDNETMQHSYTNVNLRNFIAEATFIFDPSARPIGNRDLGFLFRAGNDEAWSLTVRRNGDWELIRYDREEWYLAESGRMADDILEAQNTLTLYVDESRGAFFVNGRYISTLSLTNGPDAGDIGVVIGVFNHSQKAGEVTQFEDFTIWSVGEAPPTATPVPLSTAGPRPTSPPAGFDPTAFINSLNDMRLTIEHMGGLLDRLYHGQSQSCAEFLGYYQALRQRTPYNNLPVAWQGIYSEYNFAAENILNTNDSIRSLCESGGGYLDDLTYGIARQGIGLSLDRINQAIQAANNLRDQ
jgi:hypothetical protein